MSRAARRRVRFGRIHADAVGFDEAITRIAELVEARQGGYVVTPNVDHVVLAERGPELARAYDEASLSLVDGVPLLWLARLFGRPLPAKVSGSDLVRPLMRRAAQDGWRVYFLGGQPGVGVRAKARLQVESPGLNVVGVDAPPFGFEREAASKQAALDRLVAAAPDVVLMALGCPKQELLMRDWRAAMAPAVALGVGASLDFIAGTQRRAPAVLSRLGLEWAFRLAQDPRRMASRYLVRDWAIVPIAWRTWRTGQ